jgi:hypothetical protein
MKFGKKLGMKTVFISNDKSLVATNAKLIDQNCNNLLEYAQTCC